MPAVVQRPMHFTGRCTGVDFALFGGASVFAPAVVIQHAFEPDFREESPFGVIAEIQPDVAGFTPLEWYDDGALSNLKRAKPIRRIVEAGEFNRLIERLSVFTEGHHQAVWGMNATGLMVDTIGDTNRSERNARSQVECQQRLRCRTALPKANPIAVVEALRAKISIHKLRARRIIGIIRVRTCCTERLI